VKEIQFNGGQIELNRKTGASPLYFQIVEEIEDMISSSEYIGSYLPSQEEISLLFQVSRITVRKAMEELTARGIVQPERAKGARILKIPEKNSRYHGIGFSSRYKSLKGAASSKILQMELAYKDTKIGEILGDADADLILLKRIRLIGEIPVACETSYIIGTEVLVQAMADFQESSSLYQTLLEVNSWKIKRVEEQIHAVNCNDPVLVKQLELGDDPILFTSRISFTETGVLPVEYCETYIKSEYYGVISYSFNNL